MRFFLPMPVVNILDKLSSAGFQAYIVGGAVRDLIQGKKVGDWDFTTDAKPEEIMKLFPGSFYDNKFGTVGVPIEKEEGRRKKEEGDYEIYEITTFRTEGGYSDRRRPDRVEWGKSLEEDLSRRDFTLNAMAININQISNIKNQKYKSKIKNLGQLEGEEPIEVEAEIIDPFGGQKDLENKIIRAVGKASDRFNEDALRQMRAIRLGAQLGFEIEAETLAAIKENSWMIKEISWERIRDEILKILASEYPADGIILLYQTGLLQYILPELVAGVGLPQAGHHIYDVFTHSIESLRHCPADDPIVRLAALVHDIGKPVTFSREDGKITFYSHEVAGARMVKRIADRLRLPVWTRDKLWRLVRWHMFTYNREMTDAAIRRFIRRVGIDEIGDMMMVRVGDRKGGGSRPTSWRLKELMERIEILKYDPLQIKDLAVDGHDVMEILGVKPGPKVGKVLNELFEEILEDPKKNDREYLLARIRNFDFSQGDQSAGGVDENIGGSAVAAGDEGLVDFVGDGVKDDKQ